MICSFQNVFVYNRRQNLFKNYLSDYRKDTFTYICIPTNNPHPMEINNHERRQFNADVNDLFISKCLCLR